MCLKSVSFIECLVLNSITVHIVSRVCNLMQLLELVPDYFLLKSRWNERGILIQFVLFAFDELVHCTPSPLRDTWLLLNLILRPAGDCRGVNANVRRLYVL